MGWRGTPGQGNGDNKNLERVREFKYLVAVKLNDGCKVRLFLNEKPTKKDIKEKLLMDQFKFSVIENNAENLDKLTKWFFS